MNNDRYEKDYQLARQMAERAQSQVNSAARVVNEQPSCNKVQEGKRELHDEIDLK